MGQTIDILAGRAATYITCDCCGLPILDEPHVDPPAGDRDYVRYMHRGPCPDEDEPRTTEAA